MKIQDHIRDINTAVKNIEDQATDLQVEAYNLRCKRDDIIVENILDSEALHNTNWSIIQDSGHRIFLDYEDDTVENKLSEILRLVENDYHSNFELADGITLQLRGENGSRAVTIQFREPKQVLAFAKNHKLNLVGNNITDRLAKLKREIEALEDLCHHFNL